MADAADITTLIEEGLSRYGAGDLDGALLCWEEALAADPNNAQANSYVDYVRLNYELLTAGEPSLDETADAPFAIHEEPEYQIEIVPGQEPKPAPAPISLDPLDAGWFIDEETHDASAAVPDPGPPEEAQVTGERAPRAAESRPEISFEDNTREYHGAAQAAAAPTIPAPRNSTLDAAPNEFRDEHTGGFSPEGTPVGFSQQETEIRRRELGFVKPTASAGIEVKLRTPTPAPVAEPATEDAADGSPFELGAAGRNDSAPEDLLEGLPTPRPTTRDLPGQARPPASSSAVSQAEVALPHMTTREFERGHPFHDDQLRGAPTRELGLRPGGRPATAPMEEEPPTRESDARAIRESASRRAETKPAKPTHEGARPDGGRQDGTRQDIVLPFDPIDARSAQILDDVDDGAPTGEARDDQTRRRITALMERATGWSSTSELDKAVTAVDLALSEDPNSPLAQKLIHRNRDVIMQVFQAFLGDLDRQPQLARPLHELAKAPISPRAAFLLSRIDGGLTIDEILDVSGMPRLEAYRHLCQLYLRGILK